MLALLQQTGTIEIAASAVTGLGCILATIGTNAYYYGKFTGKVTEKLHALEKSRDAHERTHEQLGKEQNLQWKEIGEVGEKVAYLEGRLNGKPKPHIP